jgi:hypothetical protein
MKKFLISLMLVIIFSLPVFSQKLNISNLDLEAAVEVLKAGNSLNTKIFYLWSGAVSKIETVGETIEVTVVKAHWVDKSMLVTSKAVVKITDLQTVDKVKKIGLNKKIVFIAEIIDIKDNIIPVCNALLIRED